MKLPVEKSKGPWKKGKKHREAAYSLLEEHQDIKQRYFGNYSPLIYGENSENNFSNYVNILKNHYEKIKEKFGEIQSIERKFDQAEKLYHENQKEYSTEILEDILMKLHNKIIYIQSANMTKKESDEKLLELEKIKRNRESLK